MREMLEPIFGPTGAVIVQFVITLAIVLLLVAAVIWAVRRYSHGGFSATGRGRLPRLAIVDAMAIDNRRRLVLVRRDNVEHLLLIGGPTDILVEPTIMRARVPAARPAQPGQAAPAAAAGRVQATPSGPAPARTRPAEPPPAPSPSPTPAEPPAPAVAETGPTPAAPPAASPQRLDRVGADQPIPFPPRRSPVGSRPISQRPTPVRRPTEAPEPQRQRSRFAPVVEPPARPGQPERPEPGVASGRFEEVAQPTRVEPSFSQDDLASVTDEPSAPTSETARSEQEEEYALPPPLEPEEPSAPPEPEAPATAADERAPSGDESESDTAAKVSDLEKEMARLLGEISGRRS